MLIIILTIVTKFSSLDSGLSTHSDADHIVSFTHLLPAATLGGTGTFMSACPPHPRPMTPCNPSFHESLAHPSLILSESAVPATNCSVISQLRFLGAGTSRPAGTWCLCYLWTLFTEGKIKRVNVTLGSGAWRGPGGDLDRRSPKLKVCCFTLLLSNDKDLFGGWGAGRHSTVPNRLLKVGACEHNPSF